MTRGPMIERQKHGVGRGAIEIGRGIENLIGDPSISAERRLQVEPVPRAGDGQMVAGEIECRLPQQAQMELRKLHACRPLLAPARQRRGPGSGPDPG